MRIGISYTPAHANPNEWAEKLRKLKCGAAVFPVSWDAGIDLIDAYVKAAQDKDIVIAEVGAWSNPMSPDETERRKNIEYCIKQLKLADYIGAKCCVNISGARGKRWDGGYKDNFSEDTYSLVTETVREIINGADPKKTCYTLETMPNMFPDSPEQYLRILNDINDPRFSVHLDVFNMISSPRIYFSSGEFFKHCFNLLGPQIKSCHLKDTLLHDGFPVTLLEAPCGTGGTDIKTFLCCAEETNTELPVIIEHLPDFDSYLLALERVFTILSDEGISLK